MLVELVDDLVNVSLVGELVGDLVCFSVCMCGVVVIIIGCYCDEVVLMLGDIFVVGLYGSDFFGDIVWIDQDVVCMVVICLLLFVLVDLVVVYLGVILEDKGVGFVLYWCGVLGVVEVMLCVVDQMFVVLGLDWWMQYGKCVVEICLVGDDKGVVLCWFMVELVFVDRCFVVFGDDLNDLFMLQVVCDFGGIVVVLGEWDLFVDLCFVGFVVLVVWLLERLVV